MVIVFNWYVIFFDPILFRDWNYLNRICIDDYQVNVDCCEIVIVDFKIKAWILISTFTDFFVFDDFITIDFFFYYFKFTIFTVNFLIWIVMHQCWRILHVLNCVMFLIDCFVLFFTNFILWIQHLEIFFNFNLKFSILILSFFLLWLFLRVITQCLLILHVVEWHFATILWIIDEMIMCHLNFVDNVLAFFKQVIVFFTNVIHFFH